MAEKAIEDSRKYKAEIGGKIATANKDLRDRMRSDGYEIEYSPDDDYLRVLLGMPKVNDSISVEDKELYFVYLFDPETYEIHGLEVPGFKEQYEKVQPVNAFLRLVMEMIQRYGNTVSIPPRADTERAEKALGDMISV